MKEFKEEIGKLFLKLRDKNPFAFSKYADGEWSAINNENLDNNEFQNNELVPQFQRDRLIESIQFKDKDYFIGVCCPCCNGDRSSKMREFSGQDEDHMTFANIFVNANYQFYLENFLKEFGNHEVHLVANENSIVSDLPFPIQKFYPIKYNAWVNNYDLIEKISEQNLIGKLFLFCAGPFGNLLCHQLFKNNPNNIYLDIGSTLNPWLKSEGFKRDYYSGGSQFSNRVCIW